MIILIYFIKRTHFIIPHLYNFIDIYLWILMIAYLYSDRKLSKNWQMNCLIDIYLRDTNILVLVEK